MDDALLAGTLALAVPLWMERVKAYPEEIRLARARECGQVVAERGDIIQFRAKKRGETARAFNALAEGIACAAFQPGGITFLGQHWCRDHEACRRAEAAEIG